MTASFPLRAQRRSPAFTLLELLAVIGIIAVLTGLVIGVGRRAADSGRAARARGELAALGVALAAYHDTHGDYPRTNDPARLLQALIGRRGPDHQPVSGRALLETDRFTTGAGLDPFGDPQAVLVDPWGRPYRYAYKSPAPWSNPTFLLYSAGPDGAAEDELQAGGFPDLNAASNADNLRFE